MCLGFETFKTLYLVSIWRERESTTERLSVAIVLPSGVGPREFSLRTTDCEEYIELTVSWPGALGGPSVMDRRWMNSNDDDKMLEDHSKLGGFVKALKSLRN